MITLGELLSIRFFKGFRFATKEVGLNNTISSSGFFEWESKSDIRRTFRKGEFVVTTLSVAKDDIKYGEDCLKILIANGASAIAVKDIYFKDVSDKLKKATSSGRQFRKSAYTSLAFQYNSSLSFDVK